jgi:hypothetical protein
VIPQVFGVVQSQVYSAVRFQVNNDGPNTFIVLLGGKLEGLSL